MTTKKSTRAAARDAILRPLTPAQRRRLPAEVVVVIDLLVVLIRKIQALKLGGPS